jgi:hypothetical protein
VTGGEIHEAQSIDRVDTERGKFDHVAAGHLIIDGVIGQIKPDIDNALSELAVYH